MIFLESILKFANDMKASDVHITVGVPPKVRANGRLVAMDFPVLTPEDTKAIAVDIMNPQQLAAFEERGEYDMSLTIPEFGRYRVNVYKQRGSVALALRLVGMRIPNPEDLGIPQSVVDLYERKRGLILVTGPTGSGKSTTLAALINKINEERDAHIITLEDPIEYMHKHKKSIVNQREIGMDSHDYANALRAALREDPDVILVGEMRDLETISIAVRAAETGHLVLSTLHTIGAASTVDRVIDVFPPHQQQQIRTQLADILECVVAEQLLPKIEGKGRVGVFEVMLGNNAIRNYIREGKTFQITSTMQTSRAQGMITMDEALQQLYNSGQISRDTAIRLAKDKVAQEARIM